MNKVTQEMNISPLLGEMPSEYAERLGIAYASIVNDSLKKSQGQFFTPLKIARFMASYSKFGKNSIKILDPGCGIGILSVAVIEELILKSNTIKIIELVVFETDIDILPLAENCFEYLRLWLNDRSVEFTIFLCKNDFILHNSIVLNNPENFHQVYDIVISNPPYFKLPMYDERAIAARQVIYGQTNIYSIFLLLAAKLLKADGQLIFITPRSFCSGSYFRLFRELFFSLVDLKSVHLFSSRKSAFKKDRVLQENVIVAASRKVIPDSHKRSVQSNVSEKKIIVSCSSGIEDIKNRRIKEYFASSLINLKSYQKILHLPASDLDEQIIKIFRTWAGSLNQYGLEISTGPVVDFRSVNMIKFRKAKNTVPLVWLHNVEPMNFIWPRSNGHRGRPKGQYIINDNDSLSRLVENENYVLLRRFSAKEDNKRLIAAPYFRSILPDASMVGIENHLNYIYRKKGELTVEETIGLAALLNSSLFDIYFRTFNGNINVSATELRDFPLPSFELIQKLGRRVKKTKQSQYSHSIDKLVSDTFNISIDLSKVYG